MAVPVEAPEIGREGDPIHPHRKHPVCEDVGRTERHPVRGHTRHHHLLGGGVLEDLPTVDHVPAVEHHPLRRRVVHRCVGEHSVPDILPHGHDRTSRIERAKRDRPELLHRGAGKTAVLHGHPPCRRVHGLCGEVSGVPRRWGQIRSDETRSERRVKEHPHPARRCPIHLGDHRRRVGIGDIEAIGAGQGPVVQVPFVTALVDAQCAVNPRNPLDGAPIAQPPQRDFKGPTRGPIGHDHGAGGERRGVERPQG